MLNLQPPKAKDRNIVLHQWLKTAVGLHIKDNFSEAEIYYQAILRSQPAYFHAVHMLGVLRRQQGRHIEAVKLLRHAVKLNANTAGLHSDLGTTLGQLERWQEALGSYERSIALEPNNAAAHNDRAAMLFKLNRFEEAVEGIRSAIALSPHYAEAHYNLAAALKALDRLDEALGSIDAAISDRPNYANAYNMRGQILTELRRDDYGLEDFDRAILIWPDFIDAIVNRGVCLIELNRADEAISAFANVLLAQPNHVDAHFSYGNALAELGHASEAITAYDRALMLSPALSKAGFNRARQFLLLGDLSTGWQDYERRFEQPRASNRWRPGPYPIWTGQPIAGKRIIVFDEQGIGDVIQFARYLPLLAEQGADVTLLALPQLRRLLHSLPSNITLIDSEPMGSFDFQCHLLSLPKAFKTTLETIPASTAYLQAEQPLVHKWRLVLGSQGLKVGIAWQGNPVGKVDIGRSIPLRCFAPLAAIPGVRLVSLQKNHGLDQLADLPSEMEVETLGSDFDEGPDAFVDTAAVMANLDLIITSDTSIAHLAGALGRPVWLALKHVPDWRWMLDREDSPWYPTMRLYRQTTRGDWTGVFERIAMDLARFEKDDR